MESTVLSVARLPNGNFVVLYQYGTSMGLVFQILTPDMEFYGERIFVAEVSGSFGTVYATGDGFFVVW